MIKEYWPAYATEKSWKRLTEMSKEFKFILIGGWAVYLYTDVHKSKDIDIIVDLDTLYKLKEKYIIKKNMRLKKYEIEGEGFDIDIYVPYFSALAIPIEDIFKMSHNTIKGIKVVNPEVLLMLKQAAFIGRKGSIKGSKDAIDIVTLLSSGVVNLEKYVKLTKKYGHKNYIKNLFLLISSFRDIEYLSIKPREFQKWKQKTIKKLKVFY